MAGGLTISTLNDSSGVLATQNGMNGICKAWVQFNAQTSVIAGSFNVSSITRNGTGDSTINFTTAMPNANYAISGSAGDGINGTVTVAGIRPGTISTSSVRISINYTNSGGPNLYDYPYTSVAIFR